MSAPKYTVEPGRGIARTADGKVLVTLHRVLEEPSKENGYCTGLHTMSPCEADDFTHEVVLGLNHHGALSEAVRWLLKTGENGTHFDSWDIAMAAAREVLAAYDREKASR